MAYYSSTTRADARPSLFSTERSGMLAVLVGALVTVVVGLVLVVAANRQEVSVHSATVVSVTEEQRTLMCGKVPCTRTVYVTAVDLGSRAVVVELDHRTEPGSALVVYQTGDSFHDYSPTSAYGYGLIVMLAVLAGVCAGVFAAMLAILRG